jgi:hypothetical protein
MGKKARAMRLSKIAAVAAAALAIGGLTACGSQAAQSAPAPAVTKTVIHKTVIHKKTVVVPAPAPAPNTGLRYVGIGTQGEQVYANGSTSDPFALAVEADYWSNGGGSFYSFSPVTGQSYLMSASTAGHSVVVTGGNGAQVQFSW